jgi:hypothetical protein
MPPSAIHPIWVLRVTIRAPLQEAPTRKRVNRLGPP